LGLDAMGLDFEEPDVLELDSMERNGELDALKLDSMESDTGLEVLCRNLLARHLFLDLCSLTLEKGALGSDMPA